ncbi:MAG: hypothetical protein AB8H86_06870 [Polyangiales bacterium]
MDYGLPEKKELPGAVPFTVRLHPVALGLVVSLLVALFGAICIFVWWNSSPHRGFDDLDIGIQAVVSTGALSVLSGIVGVVWGTLRRRKHRSLIA